VSAPYLRLQLVVACQSSVLFMRGSQVGSHCFEKG
jgi:hypothetical protein